MQGNSEISFFFPSLCMWSQLMHYLLQYSKLIWILGCQYKSFKYLPTTLLRKNRKWNNNAIEMIAVWINSLSGGVVKSSGYSDFVTFISRAPTLEWYVLELASEYMLWSTHAAVWFLSWTRNLNPHLFDCSAMNYDQMLYINCKQNSIIIFFSNKSSISLYNLNSIKLILLKCVQFLIPNCWSWDSIEKTRLGIL